MGPATGMPVGRLGLLVVLACIALLQPAAAQNYTALRGGVMLPPQCPTDNVTEAKELAALLEKLPQLKGTPGEQQLNFLSASSRSKLNNLTGNAEEWLKNRTAIQLEELFEDVRSTNFRRMMALASITTQLPKAFSSSNVIRALELLQTEDLERLASLPLFEERYQRLTNVTLLDLIQQLYTFGLTQVPQRTCLLSAANTSAFSRLPTPPEAAAAAPATQQSDGIFASNFSAIRGDPTAPVFYNVLSYDPATAAAASVAPAAAAPSAGRRRSSSRHRRRLLEVFAGGWMHLDHTEAAEAVVAVVTQGPSGGSGRRMLLQNVAPVPGSAAAAAAINPAAEHTLAPIVTKFLDGLQPTPNADGSTSFQNPGTSAQTPEQAQEALNALLSKAATVPGISTAAGYLDTRAVGSGCSEALGRFRISSSGNMINIQGTGRRGGSGGLGGAQAPKKAANATSPNRSLNLPAANCTGTVVNGTGCVPCANGTVWNATLRACVATATAPTSPCNNNGTSTNGTLCGSSPAAPADNSTAPSVLNTTTPLNTTTDSPGNAASNLTTSAGDVVPLNSSLIAGGGGVVPTNGSLVVGSDPLLPAAALNATGGGLVSGPQILAPAGGDANISAPLVVPPTPVPGAEAGGNASSGVLPANEGLVGPGLQAGNPAASPAPGGAVVAPGTPLTDPAGAIGTSPSPALADPAAVQPLDPALNPAAAASPAPTQPQLVTPEVLAPGPLANAPAASPAVDKQGAVGVVVPGAEGLVQQPGGNTVVPPAAVVQPGAVTPTPTPPVVQPADVVAPVTPVVAPTPVQEPVVQAPQPVVQPAVTPAQVVPTATPVACVGQWVESPTCDAPCEGAGTKTATFTVTTPEANGGAPCEAANGATKQVPCTSQVACPPKPVPVNCVGSWGPPTGPCSGPCQGAGTQTSVFTVTTPEANGGAPCEAANGATKQVPCTNPDPCPVNCVGAWGPPGACDATCEASGTATSTYTVTTPAAHGGAPCEAASGATRATPCTNPNPCPKAAEPVVAPPAPVVTPTPNPVAAPTPPPVVTAPPVVEPTPVATPPPAPAPVKVEPVVAPAAAAVAPADIVTPAVLP